MLSFYDKNAKVWYGRDVLPLYNPKISLAQALLNSMTTFGPKIAQISDNNGVQMTFDEIKINTIRAAQNLQARGYEQKQVFCLIAKNHHHAAAITFASIALGCPLNTVDSSFSQTEYTHMLGITKPVLVFCDVNCYETVSQCLAKLGNNAKIFTFGGTKNNSEPVENLLTETHREHKFMLVKVDGTSETAIILCSSGTTGLPKGVCVSHAALLDENIKENNAFDCNAVMLCFSSLYWVSGMGTLLKGTLFGFTRIITTESYTPELQLHLIAKYKVTHTLNATHQVALMLKSEHFDKTDLSSIKYLLVGGSKVPFHLKTEMKQRQPNGNVLVGIGMSEIGGLMAMDFPPKLEKDIVGRPLDGLCIKIADDDGNRCGVNVNGEICIKAEYKFLGYYDNQKATDEIFDDEGFLKTGDVGHFDEDGDLSVIDRKKDLLKYCNYQIAPTEIDAFLTESPEIKSACVVGIPDVVTTDLPAAVIVRAKGSNITEKDICVMVADHFADHYKLRGGVYFVDSLPTTPSGKVLRRKVKETAIEYYNKQALK